ENFAVDVHPAGHIGSGIMMDHGTGVAIGETAVVANDASSMHEVTRGGTVEHGGDRQPKSSQGCLISVGAKILVYIEIGEGAKVGGGAVVLIDVSPHTTVACIPAKPVGTVRGAPSKDMDQSFNDDPSRNFAEGI